MNSSQSESLVTIGKIVAAHGIKGEVKVLPLSAFTQRFQLLKRVFVKKDTVLKELHVANVRLTESEIILKFTECSDRNSAESLKHYSLCVAEAERFQLPEDYFYYDDLVGMIVLDENQKRIGKVISVYERGVQDCLVIDLENGREAMVPFHRSFIQRVDVVNQEITIRPIMGLLEE